MLTEIRHIQRSPADLNEGDIRLQLPRFSEENFPKVLQVVDGIHAVAKKYNATAGQVTLAWLLAQGDDIIPIPGTTRIPVRRPSPSALCTNTPTDCMRLEFPGEHRVAAGEAVAGGH